SSASVACSSTASTGASRPPKQPDLIREKTNMRLRHYLLVGALAVTLAPSMGLTQFGDAPGGFGRGGRRGRGGGMGGAGRTDPNEMFNRMANGKEVVTRADVTNPFLQGMFDRMTQSLGVTNGQLTRQQFVTAMQQRMGSTGARAGGPTAGGSPSGPSGPGAFARGGRRGGG